MSQEPSLDYEDLYKWVEEHTITRQKRNINRDFSDALPLVEILKFHFPKLVDPHNYTAKNSFAHKLINWQTLNRKVLSKLRINLTQDSMENLANCVPGEIEKLLSKVRRRIESKSARLDSAVESQDILYVDCAANELTEVLPIRVKTRGKMSNRKAIPEEVYDKMQSDLAEKDEAILTLKQKVDHLESLVEIKEGMIKDLKQQLETLVNAPPPTPIRKREGSSIFKLF